MAGLKDAIYGTSLYQFTLRGRFPHALTLQPADPWPGDAAEADEMFRGRWRLGGQDVDAGRAMPFALADAPETWRVALHGFEWLRHFTASDSNAATRAARTLVADWLDRHTLFDPFVWRTDILARRLVNWCLNMELLARNAELTYRSDVLRSLARQARHLSRTVESVPPGAPALQAATALALLGICLPDSKAWTERGLRLLGDALTRQVLPDGGHVSRDPETLHLVLRDLLMLKRTMMEIGEPPPEGLVNAIDRMAPTLRMLRHDDGGLGLFNGATEGRADLIEATLKQAAARGKPNLSAPKSGFERMQGGRTVVIADFGGPVPQPGVGHAGLLSFEMSHQRERIVVNGGSARPATPQWSRALASTAAHSTLCLADTNAVGVPEAGKRRSRRLEADAIRSESGGETVVDLMHTGYQEGFGVVHRRRLHLDAAGRELRGEDRLERLERRRNGGPLPFAIRFHLHPDVQAVLAQGGDGALLRLKSGRGWRFRVAGAHLALEESVYLGNGAPRRTAQLVLDGQLTDGDTIVVRWGFSRIDGAGPSRAEQEETGE
ncbi:MAG: heparinase II/III family protein [Pseudomonadota bacterium]|nr:heparinase II/III family protein [Pseudomonadota bacterium]